MRWTDLPAGSGPADDGDSPVLRRGDWEDLRRRLERLPPGHPSAPDGGGEADEDVEDGERAGGRGEPDAGQGPEPGRGRVGRPAGRGGSDARSSPAAGGQREPYRPWFTAGETPEPWFYADSEG